MLHLDGAGGTPGVRIAPGGLPVARGRLQNAIERSLPRGDGSRPSARPCAQVLPFAIETILKGMTTRANIRLAVRAVETSHLLRMQGFDHLEHVLRRYGPIMSPEVREAYLVRLLELTDPRFYELPIYEVQNGRDESLIRGCRVPAVPASLECKNRRRKGRRPRSDEGMETRNRWRRSTPSRRRCRMLQTEAGSGADVLVDFVLPEVPQRI